MLAAALQHRRDFYSRLGDTEKWVKKIQRKLDSGNEIYSDEVGDTQAKLKVSGRVLEQGVPVCDRVDMESSLNSIRHSAWR